MSDDTVPKDQLKTALNYLEWSHGYALNRPWSNEVLAYYHAVQIVEDALNEELLPHDEVPLNDSEQALIAKSREARDAGYTEATLFEERYGNTNSEDKPFLRRLRSRLRRVLFRVQAP